MPYKFKCYFTFRDNITRLNSALESALPQLLEFSTEEKPICIINDTNAPIESLITIPLDKVELLHPPVPILLPETLNWIFKMTYDNQEPWAMWLHTDAVLLPGAMADIIRKYEQVKDKAWGLIYERNQAFALFNTKVIHDEQLFYDAWLFPMYYMDNHFHRILAIRGYPEFLTDIPDLVKHDKSHTLREDPGLSRRNSLAFDLHGTLYRRIHGGSPGQEKELDRTLHGLFPFTGKK